MLLEINKSIDLDQPAERIWDIVRDPAVVAGAIPHIRDFRAVQGDEKFEATVEDKLGPFKVEIPVAIAVSSDAVARRMAVKISGNDSRGQARVRGNLAASVVAVDAGSRLELAATLEVLGKLAALGAVPMRRRADQIFDVFVRNLSELLGQPVQRG